MTLYNNVLYYVSVRTNHISQGVNNMRGKYLPSVRIHGYRVVNMTTGQVFEGNVKNAKAAYSRIIINKGDTTVLTYGYQTSVKEW